MNAYNYFFYKIYGWYRDDWCIVRSRTVDADIVDSITAVIYDNYQPRLRFTYINNLLSTLIHTDACFTHNLLIHGRHTTASVGHAWQPTVWFRRHAWLVRNAWRAPLRIMPCILRGPEYVLLPMQALAALESHSVMSVVVECPRCCEKYSSGMDAAYGRQRGDAIACIWNDLLRNRL